MSEFRRIRYVERVREATRTLIEDVLEANRRLRLTVTMLGEERSDAAREDLSELDKRSERWRTEQQSVLSLLEAVDTESRRFEEQFADVERQNSNLATLYAAGHALHASLDHAAVLSAASSPGATTRARQTGDRAHHDERALRRQLRPSHGP